MCNYSTEGGFANNEYLTGEILEDKSGTGKPRQWKKYKEQSLAVAKAYSLLEYLASYGQKISECGAWLRFSRCPNGHVKYLINASFCRCRLCTICQWRKSLVMFHQVLQLIHAHKSKYQSDVPLMLTLTVPNASAQGLAAHLDMMAKAWKKLTERKQVKLAVRGWFRGLEVTYNKKRGDFHPHFHVLLMVPRAYFDKTRDLYIDRDEWLSLWQEATGLPDITQVDIRPIRKRGKHGAIEAASAEVAKYATKPSSYIDQLPSGDFITDPKVIEALHLVLKGRRLTAFGGLFRQLRKELKQDDVENSDLINISDDLRSCNCPICQSTLVEEMFRWHVGVKEYVG